MAVDVDATDSELSSAADELVTGEETEGAAGAGTPVQLNAVPDSPSFTRDRFPIKPALISGLAMIVALAALVGLLSYRYYETRRADDQRHAFLQAGRQGAQYLTTIDHARVDADVNRILDFTTGLFHDDFQKRSPAFIDAIKKNQSNSVGTIAEAGLESIQGDTARILVAANVRTSTVTDPAQPPKAWRMRIDVRKVGDQLKIADVKFVP